MRLPPNNSFCPSLYCAFLNTGGRILFDAIVSPSPDQPGFLLEVDSSLASLARKHMTLYKVRRKLTISVSEEETVHAVFRDPGGELEHSSCGHRLATRAPHLGSTFCDGGEVGEELEPLDSGSQTYPDPRLGALGHRLVVARGLEGGALALLPPGTQECHPNTYNLLMYCSISTASCYLLLC